MNSIIYDDKIITPEGDKYNYYYNFLKRLDKKSCVKLSLFCAKTINDNNNKESNLCIELVEKWLKDEKSVSREKLWDAAYTAYYYADAYAAADATYCAYAASVVDYNYNTAFYAVYAFSYVLSAQVNKYLQILLRKTKQFGNNKVLEQISKTDVDKLELVDWNMITDIMQEKYNIIHEFSYEDIFSRRCLIELLRREYV